MSDLQKRNSGGVRSSPAATWLAAQTMRSIAMHLLMNATNVEALGYKDRDEMAADAKLAERHGYLVVAAARLLSIDAQPLIEVLEQDRLWEFPNSDDVPTFRGAGEICRKVAIEARIWCAEDGIDPQVFLRELAGSPAITKDTETSVIVSESQPKALPSGSDAPAGPIPPDRFAWKQNEEVILTPIAHRIISALWKAKNHTIPKQHLKDAVYGHDEDKSDAALTTAISRLNSKLGSLEGGPAVRETNGYVTFDAGGER